MNQVPKWICEGLYPTVKTYQGMVAPSLKTWAVFCSERFVDQKDGVADQDDLSTEPVHFWVGVRWQRARQDDLDEAPTFHEQVCGAFIGPESRHLQIAEEDCQFLGYSYSENADLSDWLHEMKYARHCYQGMMGGNSRDSTR